MEEEIKRALRFKTDALNDEISDNIEAARADLKRLGINPDSGNKLVQKAIELYCKWQFDFREEGERFKVCYQELRDSMRLSTLEEES